MNNDAVRKKHYIADNFHIKTKAELNSNFHKVYQYLNYIPAIPRNNLMLHFSRSHNFS